MSKAQEKQAEKMARYVAEVKATLEQRLDPLNNRHWGDNRVRSILSGEKYGVFNREWNYGDSYSYELATTTRGGLTAQAIAFCKANGLTELAEKFNRKALENYVVQRTQRLRQQREQLETQLAEINKQIEAIESLLPADSVAQDATN